ncbi:MAG: hypothetical protein O2894_03510 [Planctomycetota bacterium]|nr:hypothetical protein [Planctomycetota bacterium]
MTGFTSWFTNVVCGLLAYTGSRFIWAEKDTGFTKLPWELLTFAALYLLLQLIVRGRRLARRGRDS